MQTSYIKVNPTHPQTEAINKAALVIKTHGVVAFPTETVYGLGANAYDAGAVAKIFAAKNRPASTPLLVHVSNLEQVYDLVSGLSDSARLLMQSFWPGPLSLVLPARSKVPAAVTAGLNSVGLRMPSHPVALALIEQTGPLAAPSANLSGRPSPVTPDHVKADLDGRIDCVLDAGPTGSGIESTVLDLSVSPFKILRRGGVAVEEIESVLGEKITAAEAFKGPHYQIAATITMARDQAHLQQLLDRQGNDTGLVYYDAEPALNHNLIHKYRLDLTGQHGSLYSILRDAEARQLKVLVFAPLPSKAEGVTAALIDRIHEAAAGKDNSPPIP